MKKQAVLAALWFALCSACSGAGPECLVGADCASGICRSDGTCEPVHDEPDGGDAGGEEPPDGGTTDEGIADDQVGDEAAWPDESTGDDAAPSCIPNHDWVVERSEMPLRPGLRATFAVGLDAEVDTTGQDTGGVRRWNFIGPYPNDHLILGQLVDPSGSWYAAEFPGASYVSRLSDRETLLGVFRITADGLDLLGVVSPEDGFGKTLLKYDPPAAVLRFPLEQGATWSSDSTVTGTAQGVYTIYRESYDSVVDAGGEVETPYGTFPALRVRVKMTRVVGAIPTVIRSFAFVAECFGTVVKIDSENNETRQEFTRAAEIWRLSP